ncbi:hypothetical protein YC2023_095759 [Brassica napus]
MTSRLEELFQAASDDPKCTGSGGYFPTEKNKKYYKPAQRKKGRMYEVCFISKSLSSTPATFSCGTSSFGSGTKHLNNQNAQTRKLSAVCDYLATKDSTVATILQTPTMSFENF